MHRSRVLQGPDHAGVIHLAVPDQIGGSVDLVGLLTDLIIFSLFSPVNFPVERMPNWLETIHRFLLV